MDLLKHLKRLKRGLSLEDLEKSPSFCVMPWVHLHTTQYGDVTPCCQSPWDKNSSFGNLNESTIEEVWFGEKMNLFRKTLINGKPDKRCFGCYKKEREGWKSLRQITNANFKSRFEFALSNPTLEKHNDHQPIYFDIRFSNKCNLKCRICGPWSSSSWHNDAIKTGLIAADSKQLTSAFDNAEHFFEQLNPLIEHAEEFYFAGGEPLIMDEHYRILELLISKGKTNVRLVYNTNFSVLKYKNYDLIDLWKNFESVSIAASLDAEGQKGEVLRKNMKWDNVLNNRRLIQKHLPNIQFIVSPTLNIYNLFHLPVFHKSWTSLELIGVEDFIPTLLTEPKHLSVKHIPQEHKIKARTLYKKHIGWIKTQKANDEDKFGFMLGQFENIVKILVTQGEDLSSTLATKSRELDLIREEDCKTVFEELRDIL